MGGVCLSFVEHTIKPVYDENSKILILGTIPSPKSREHGFYYSHPQNRFWKLMSIIFNTALPVNNEQKRKLLLENHIALWDVLKSCDIKGAGDSSIKNPEVNDIVWLLRESKIETIFTTGRKATDLYNKYCREYTNIDTYYLPSTSPANCANFSLEDLVREYEVIKKYL